MSSLGGGLGFDQYEQGEAKGAFSLVYTDVHRAAANKKDREDLGGGGHMIIQLRTASSKSVSVCVRVKILRRATQPLTHCPRWL
jgi:hypothetical protein